MDPIFTLSVHVTHVTVTINPKNTFDAAPLDAKTVPPNNILAWSFHGVPAGFRPTIDFVGFRAPDTTDVLTEFEKPTGELLLGGVSPEGVLSATQVLNALPGEYWYKVSLVPNRGVDNLVARLDCAKYYDGHPGAGIKVPPSRPVTDGVDPRIVNVMIAEG